MSDNSNRDEELGEKNAEEQNNIATNSPQAHNGNHNSSKRRRPLGAMVENFAPSWFAICMNTGILGIIMHSFPYQFRGLPVLSTIMYLLDIMLFSVFSVIFISRLIAYPTSTWEKISRDASQLSYLATWPIAFLTLAVQTAMTPSNASWGGHGFTILSYVMWWIGAAWMFCTSCFVYITIFKRNTVDYSTIHPSMIIPAVGVATAAATGGLVVNYSFEMSARLAMPMVMFGYLLLGQGIFLGVILFALYLLNLLVKGFPKGPTAPSLILFLGPPGQTGTALQVLGTAANTMGVFSNYHKGTFLQSEPAASLDAASIMISLLLFGFGIFWTVVALFGILESFWKGEMKWTFVWWSTVFPAATMNTACLLYATEMDSPAWRVLTAGIFLILFIDYLVCWGFTIYQAITGDLLIPKSAWKRAQ